MAYPDHHEIVYFRSPETALEVADGGKTNWRKRC